MPKLSIPRGKDKIYRIQDQRGRGPFLLTKEWLDKDKDVQFYQNHPAAMQVFKDELQELLTIAENSPIHYFIGFGCRTFKDLKSWFSKTEYQTLLTLGFECVCLSQVKIYAETNNQCLFVRRKPLNKHFEHCFLYPHDWE